MNNIALNFVPLLNQNISATIYRKLVPDSTRKKNKEDFRAPLPAQTPDTKWPLYDISTTEKDGYELYKFTYTQNSMFSLNLIYKEFLKILKNQKAAADYYIPKNTIVQKSVHFITEKFDEGATEIVIKPYYLRRKKQLGFLVFHKFSKRHNKKYNKQIQIKSLSLDKSGKPNIYYYRDKKRMIVDFIKNTLSPILSNSSLNIKLTFSSLPANTLNMKTYLVGQENTAKSQFMGIKVNGPYRQIRDEIRYLFVFDERTRSLARDIYLGLIGKLFPSQFPGLNQMFNIPIHKDIVEHLLVNTFDASAIEICESRARATIMSYPNCKLMIVAILPKGFKGVETAYDVYGHLKLLALRNNAYCQVATEDTFYRKDQLKWSVSNIGLQIFSKLGGAPWLVRPAKTNCLIFGLGSVQEWIDDHISRYSAYTVCLDSSGDFKYIKPLSSSRDEATYLIGLQSKLKEVLSTDFDDRYNTVVLHIPYRISFREIEIIKSVVSEVRETEDFELIAIKINTIHNFFGFSNHNTCIPYESTYIQISDNDFLVWADGLQYGKKALHRRVAEPLYVSFITSQEQWTTKKECLQDILNLSGANWRGFNSKAQPISILYSKLVAGFIKDFSHLDSVGNISFVSADSTAPWFL